MKNKNLLLVKSAIRLFLILMLLPTLFIRCSISDDISKLKSSLDSMKIVISNPEFKHAVHFDVKDASTGNYLNGVSVKIKISGDGASKLYDNIGSQSSDFTYTTKSGILNLVLDPKIDSTTLAENPVKFTITPVADGYTGVSQQVSIAGEKIKLVDVQLVNKSDLPAGVKVSSQALGTVQNGVAAASVSQQVNGQNTTVELPAGTVLTTTRGKAISGTINSQVVFYSPNDSATQAMIASNLAGEVVLSDNSTASGQLISGGMFNAVLTSGTDTVKNLTGKGLVLKTRVPLDMMNPLTGKAVAKGDIIQMWSEEEGTGTWKYEKDALVKGDNEGLYLQDTIKHLSSWNWDWHINSCSVGPTINWTFSGFQTGTKSAMPLVSLKFNSMPYPYCRYISISESDTKSTFLNTLSNTAGVMTFTDPYPVPGRTLTFEPASIPFSDLCSMGTKNVTIKATYNSNFIVNLNLSATNGSTVIKPSLLLGFQSPNTNYFNWVNMSKGHVSFSVQTNTTYRIAASLGSYTGYGTIQINDYGINQLQAVVVPIMPNGTAGSKIYMTPITKPAYGNPINIDYTAVITSDVFNQLKAKGTPIEN